MITATEPSASLHTSRNAARMFMLSFDCARSTNMDPIFEAKPRMPKNNSSRTSCTDSDSTPVSLSTASMSAYRPTNMSTSPPPAAVMISRRAQPHVFDLSGLRRMSAAVTVDAVSTATSVVICPASTNNAKEPVSAAPTTSATRIVAVSAKVTMSRLKCPSVPFTGAWECSCAISPPIFSCQVVYPVCAGHP